MFHRILITIIAVSICLSSFAVYLSAQEKKDDKRCEISVNLGIERHIDVPCVGLSLEYFTSPRVSVDVEINYIPKKAYAFAPRDWWRPGGEFDFNFIGEEAKYLLLCDINFLFYFDLTKVKRPMRWFLTVGTGFQYDRMEYHVVSLSTLELDKYGFGEMHYQPLTFGAGFKVNIKEDWALRILYKIHMMAADVITTRLALGLSYRF